MCLILYAPPVNNISLPVEFKFGNNRNWVDSLVVIYIIENSAENQDRNRVSHKTERF